MLVLHFVVVIVGGLRAMLLLFCVVQLLATSLFAAMLFVETAKKSCVKNHKVKLAQCDYAVKTL